MQGMIRCALVAGFLFGCHTDDTAPPDGPVSGNAGITVDWATTPPTWPGTIKDGVTLERARFALDSLRVIGDAGPGDPRTTARTLDVRWESGTSPDQIAFADAPTGLYSQLAIQLDGHLITNSYRFEGVAHVNGVDYEFRVEDSNALPVTLSISETVSPSQNTAIRINVDFVHALESVDFASLPIDDGRLELETTSPGITEFRQKLVESFTAPTFSAVTEN
ncbi:MAG TPA: hypothetical protein VLB44_20335 [Kofleriaceae bacterium]|nr:hypothetical protein [Kofleriaceae bacterium]